MKHEKYKGKNMGDNFRERSAEEGIAFLQANPDKPEWWGHCGNSFVFARREGETIAVYDCIIDRFVRLPIV